MDFEELLLQELQTKFSGVDSKILSRIAKAKAKGIKSQEEVKTVADGITLQQIIESYGDSRANEAQDTAVKNYEKKHGLKDGKKVDEPKPATPAQPAKPEPTPADVPEWAKQLIESNKAMKAQLDQYSAERVANSRKGKYLEAIKGLPEKLRTRYEKDYARLKFESDEDFESYLAEIQPDIEALSADNTQSRSRTPSAPKSGQAPAAEPNAHVMARIKAQQEKSASAPSAIQGLPTPTA